jgi:hypothetical protein
LYVFDLSQQRHHLLFTSPSLRKIVKSDSSVGLRSHVLRWEDLTGHLKTSPVVQSALFHVENKIIKLGDCGLA